MVHFFYSMRKELNCRLVEQKALCGLMREVDGTFSNRQTRTIELDNLLP